MQHSPDDSARRRTRHWWFDPRFAIGLALVVVSIGGVVLIVGANDDSVPVYSARSALSPGDRIHIADLVVDSVRLGAAAEHYVRPHDIPAAGLVVTKTVAAGELVPTSAVGSASAVRVTSIVLPVASALSRGIVPGSVVDVWSAEKTGTGEYAAPTVLVSAATVVRLIDDGGIISSASNTSVEVLVPRSATARVLQAVSDADAISLVPAALPAR